MSVHSISFYQTAYSSGTWVRGCATSDVTCDVSSSGAWIRCCSEDRCNTHTSAATTGRQLSVLMLLTGFLLSVSLTPLSSVYSRDTY